MVEVQSGYVVQFLLLACCFLMPCTSGFVAFSSCSGYKSVSELSPQFKVTPLTEVLYLTLVNSLTFPVGPRSVVS